MNYHSTFYIKVFANGNQYPLMHLESEIKKMISELEHLARGHMSKSEGVRQELSGIEAVLKGEKELHSFGGDDWCHVDFKKDKSLIINGFDEFEPFEIESDIILNLLTDWYAFLLSYENGEIPGIIHPDKSRSV